MPKNILAVPNSFSTRKHRIKCRTVRSRGVQGRGAWLTVMLRGDFMVHVALRRGRAQQVRAEQAGEGVRCLRER